MKPFKQIVLGIIIGILVVAINLSFADEYELDENDFESRQVRQLSLEEEALADEARANIAKTIEDNLIRLFVVISTGSDRQPRQEDDDDETGVTPNPNVLPQVAQILGAIFSGSLNLTRVVDQTFYLVPNAVRNQVGGIVKLLTGESAKEAGSTTITSSGQAVTSSPQVQIPPTTTEAEKIVETTQAISESEVSAVQQANNATKGKYRIRSRVTSTTPKIKVAEDDDELEKLEKGLIQLARAYEPHVRDKEPREFISAFRHVLERIDLNSKEIPSIFEGTQESFKVLERLGVLDREVELDELTFAYD